LFVFFYLPLRREGPQLIIGPGAITNAALYTLRSAQ
jgi:hypothetical protein